ncbi:MAG: DNA primase, partial [Halobacteriales archaeon SW_9_67_25]
YVAFAPASRSVEDLSRDAVLSALREKVLYEEVAESSSPRAATVGDGTDDADGAPGERVDADGGTVARETTTDPEGATDGPSGDSGPTPTESAEASESAPDTSGPTGPTQTGEESDTRQGADGSPQTLAGHAEDVAGTGTVRLLDDALGILAEATVEDAFDAVEAAETVPDAVVLDGALTQRVLDVAAQRGVRQIVASRTGEFVKRPASVRVRTTDEF